MTATKTFRDFFVRNFNEEKFYERVNPHHFQIFYEMARWGDIAKKPVNIDKDDIEFLQQFPHKFWPKALKMRYDMLFNALENTHKNRKVQMDPLKDAIKKALTNGDWASLKGMLPDQKIAKLANHFTHYRVKKLSPKQIEEEAEREAWEHIKPSTDKVEDPSGEVPFDIKGQHDFNPETGEQIGSNRSSSTFMAKPYLNRLYHKLERTRGLPHLPDSGLDDQGKYGYNMHNPVRGPNVYHVKLKNGNEIEVHAYDEKGVADAVEKKGYNKEDIAPKGISLGSEVSHTTEGMKFPTTTTIQDRIADFLNLNGHGVFGKLPDNVQWFEAGYKDKWTINYLKEKYQRKIEDELRLSGNYETEKEIRTHATQMVNERLIQLAEQGKLKGPPIPGKAPEGLPVTVEKGKLVPPPLYLPYQIKEVKTKGKNGEIQVNKRAVPIINPAHYFRELGSEESDYKHDEEGNKVFNPETGEAVWSPDLLSSGKLRGHDNSYVHVGENEFTPNVHRASAAFQFNHDTHGRDYLSPGSEEYDTAYEKVFGDEGMGADKVSLVGNGKRTKAVKNENGEFFADIIEGLRRCWTGGRCGGATAHEGDIIATNVEDLHQLVALRLLTTLRSEKYQGNSEEAKKARRIFANDVGGGYAQYDLGEGGGTRRLRVYANRNSSIDATTSGKEGGQIGTADAQFSNIKDKNKLGGEKKGEDDIALGSGKTKRGKGSRMLPSSEQKTPYNLNNFRKIIQDLMADATDADKTSSEAREISKRQTGQEIIEMLSRGIKDKTEVMNSIVGILASLYQQSGQEHEEAMNLARSQLRGWIEDGANNAEKLVAKFQSHPLAIEAINGVKGEVTPGEKENYSSDDEKKAMDILHQSIENMRRNGLDLESPQVKDLLLPKPGQKYGVLIQSKIAPNISGVVRDQVSDKVQAEIQKMYNNTNKNPELAKAAREVTPLKPEVDTKSQANRMRELLAKKKLGGSSEPVAVPPTESWMDLHDKKDFIGVAHHQDFLRSAHLQNLEKYLGWFEKNRNVVPPEKYASAVANLKKAIEEKKGKI